MIDVQAAVDRLACEAFAHADYWIDYEGMSATIADWRAVVRAIYGADYTPPLPECLARWEADNAAEPYDS